MFTYILIGLSALTLLTLIAVFFKLTRQTHHSEITQRENLLVRLNGLQETMVEKFSQSRLELLKQTMDSLTVLQETLQKGVQDTRQQVKESLTDYAKELGTRMQDLTKSTEEKLRDINQQVEKRLADGFEKTNETFGDVIKRLALIDAAQQKITELSTNVVSLQEILNDKRSRGSFGEVQLSALIQNMIPEQNFSFQHQLSNGRRADCMLFLPEPTGNVAVDAKFPLENYRLMIDSSLNDIDKAAAERQFKIDIRKHIQDIAEKYIISGETSDGAVMFIPAEAVFAHIHAHHSDLVEFAQRSNVWLVSPTTMMAILTTARAVMKDAATRKHIHEIQKHLRHLGEDFDRFQIRMDNLAKRIAQAHSDVEQVHISSRKISSRFVQIEKADLNDITLDNPLVAIENEAL